MSATTIKDFIKVILDGDVEAVIKELHKLIKLNTPPETIIKEGIEEAVNYLDGKCSINDFNLLEIMLVGRAILKVISELYPQGPPSSQIRSTVVIGTVEGDIHDIGKNLVKIILRAKGFRVIDCGKDCPVEQMVDSVKTNAASALLLSGLITPVIPNIQRVKGLLQERGLSDVKVVAGGAALKMVSVEYLNVDYVAETVFDGLEYLEKTIK